MSGSFALLHSPFTTFSHFYYSIYLPLLPTTIIPDDSVKTNKSPLQTPTRPLFQVCRFSSENYIVMSHSAGTVLQDVSRSLIDNKVDNFNDPLWVISTFDPITIDNLYIQVNILFGVVISGGHNVFYTNHCPPFIYQLITHHNNYLIKTIGL